MTIGFALEVTMFIQKSTALFECSNNGLDGERCLSPCMMMQATGGFADLANLYTYFLNRLPRPSCSSFFAPLQRAPSNLQRSASRTPLLSHSSNVFELTLCHGTSRSFDTLSLQYLSVVLNLSPGAFPSTKSIAAISALSGSTFFRCISHTAHH